LIALVAALNPARAAFGIPSNKGSASALGLAALGGLVGGVGVCAVAALGGPLLDLLDVSEPSFRIAAGAVAALGGIADLFRRHRARAALPGGAPRWSRRDPGGALSQPVGARRRSHGSALPRRRLDGVAAALPG
jgi:hypothetical protein